jgi:hypothetical protein
MTENAQFELPPVRIAFVIDGVVQDVMHTDERLAAILLSEPLIIDITDREDASSITLGYTYNSNTSQFEFGTLSGPSILQSGNLGKDGDGLAND